LTNEIADLALLLGQWLVRHDGESSFCRRLQSLG
jgi:hypothetical protein